MNIIIAIHLSDCVASFGTPPADSVGKLGEDMTIDCSVTEFTAADKLEWISYAPNTYGQVIYTTAKANDILDDAKFEIIDTYQLKVCEYS